MWTATADQVCCFRWLGVGGGGEGKGGMYPSFPSSRLNSIDTMAKFDIFMMHILEFLGRIIIIRRNVIEFINTIIKNNTVLFL